MGHNRRFVGSIISVLLLIGLGLLRSSLYSTYHNELASNIVSVGLCMTFAYIGFDVLTSPETSILYLLNRRWTTTELASVGGMITLVVGLFGAAIQIVLIIESFSQ